MSRIEIIQLEGQIERDKLIVSESEKRLALATDRLSTLKKLYKHPASYRKQKMSNVID